ncbi:MAG: hypothetical protein ACE5ES_02150 [Candidatus Nanoarchaeia archaeon]
MVSGLKVLVFFIHLILGLYLLNLGFNVLDIPGYISQFNKAIFTISGVLVIWGGISYSRIGIIKRRER